MESRSWNRNAEDLSPFARGASPYEQWIATLGLPIHRGYYVEDVRTCEVGWWEERQCSAAILVMAGQEGQSEVRVSEIPPGKSTAPVRFAMDEVVYVAQGRGLTTISTDGFPPRTFEWQKHSLFLIPPGYVHTFSNTQGDSPVRLLHYNSLPAVMERMADPKFFFKSGYSDPELLYGDGDGFYSEARVMQSTAGRGRSSYWLGNFFPNMQAWDSLLPQTGRGAGARVVWIRYPKSRILNHMAVFPSRTYKKGHRHGPGILIVIPDGEGFSYMWPEGAEKTYIPWHEGSVFVPPNDWYHQHFNISESDNRYLAFHSPNPESSEVVQIEYTEEDPVIRATFEKRLEERGLTSLMPDECYTNAGYEWSYKD